MEDIKTLIDQMNEEQKELVLKSFTNEEACALGIQMYQKALKENKPIVISITKNRKQIFYAAMEGTSKNNEDWVRRKENTVYDFGTVTVSGMAQSEDHAFVTEALKTLK